MGQGINALPHFSFEESVMSDGWRILACLSLVLAVLSCVITTVVPLVAIAVVMLAVAVLTR